MKVLWTPFAFFIRVPPIFSAEMVVSTDGRLLRNNGSYCELEASFSCHLSLNGVKTDTDCHDIPVFNLASCNGVLSHKYEVIYTASIENKLMDQNIKLRPQGSFAMTSRGDTIFSEAKDLVGPGGRMNYWKSEVVNPCDGDQKYYGGQIEVAGHVQKMGQDKEYICHDSDDYKVKIKKEDREGLILPEIPPNATMNTNVCNRGLGKEKIEEAQSAFEELEGLPVTDFAPGFLGIFNSSYITAMVAFRELNDRVVQSSLCENEEKRGLLVVENCDDFLPELDSLIDSITAAKATLIAAEGALSVVPECGGLVSGDSCAAVVSATKIVLGALATTAAGVLLDLEIEFNEKSAQYSKCHRDISIANHDNIICPFGKFGLDFTVIGQGCDGIDNDCDEPNPTIDECDEDQVPPEIILDAKIPSIPFPTNDEARIFIEHNIRVSDDCVPWNLIEISEPDLILSNGKNRTFRVTATDPRCINEGTPASQNSEDFVLTVDSVAPNVTCGFFKPQDKNHVIDENFVIGGPVSPPYPEADDILHIDFDREKTDLVDIKLWYQIEDELAIDYSLHVDIIVKSNEFEGKGWKSRDMVAIFKEQNLFDFVHRARLFLAPFTCKDKSPSLICEDEAKSNITTRFYDIEVSATDPTGNVGQKTCSVAVIPDKHFRSKGGGSRSNNYNKSSSHAAGHSSSYPFSTSPSDGTSSKGKGKGKGAPHSRNDLRAEYSRSRQRFEIETFEHEWDPRKNTTLVVPPLPLVGKGKGKGKGGSTTSVTSTTPTQQVESPSIMPQITTTQNQMVNSGTTSFSAYPSRSPLPEEGVPPVTSTTPTVSPSKNKANKKPILWIPNN